MKKITGLGVELSSGLERQFVPEIFSIINNITMALQKLNITELKINKELDVLALTHPSQTYKIILNNPDFRKNLLNYIMKYIPTHQYLLIESQEDFYKIKKIIKCSIKEKTLIYKLVFQRFNELRNCRKTTNLSLKTVDDQKNFGFRGNAKAVSIRGSTIIHNP